MVRSKESGVKAEMMRKIYVLVETRVTVFWS